MPPFTRRSTPHPRTIRIAVLGSAALTLLAACGGGDTGPRTIKPTRLAFAAQPDSGIVGDTVALGTTAVDASGRVATSASIVYAYTSSDTTVARVSAGGVLRYVGAGSAVVTARATGLPDGNTLTLATAPLIAFAPAARVRAVPARVDVVPGVSVALGAVVYDSGGNVIPYPVHYASDNSTVAKVASTAFLAGSPGTAQVTVRADFRGRGPAAALPVTVAAVAEGAYHVDLVQLGSANPAYAQVFAQAAAFWQRVITAALPAADLDLGPEACGDGEPPIRTSTTGVTIFFRVDSIDGGGNVIGAAGPCVLRQDASSQQRGLPALGTMIFDSADFGRLVQRGTAYDVVRHEMGHVLGIGTLWNVTGVRAYLLGEGSFDPEYVGPAGQSASSILGFTRDGGSVPIENTGGSGTADSHWRSSVFGSELMTGYYTPASTHPATRLTILSLADLGYQVNVAASEPLLPASPAALRAASRAAAQAGDGASFRDLALPPLFAITPGGGMRRLRGALPLAATLGVR